MPNDFRRLLPQPTHAGLYRLLPGTRKILEREARALGYAWLQADLDHLHDTTRVLEQLGTDWQLPDWYGANFDALSDCLTDLGWQEAPGYVLLVTGADALRTQNGQAWVVLNQVFADVVDSWREQGVPFWVFHDLAAGDPADLAAPPTP